MATAKVAASLLVKDYNVYPRASVDEYHVREIAEAISVEHQLPPIIADRESKRIVDGFHRHAAWQKVHGADVKVEVVWKSYGSEADLFRDAATLNAGHGRILTTYDKARCLGIADQLGLTQDSIADALHMTKERADKLVMTRLTADGQPLKNTMRQFAGETLTGSQKETNQKAGGMAPLFYINQVSALLESDSLEWENPQVRAGLSRLQNLLNAQIDTHIALIEG